MALSPPSSFEFVEVRVQGVETSVPLHLGVLAIDVNFQAPEEPDGIGLPLHFEEVRRGLIKRR